MLEENFIKTSINVIDFFLNSLDNCVVNKFENASSLPKFFFDLFRLLFSNFEQSFQQFLYDILEKFWYNKNRLKIFQLLS